MRIIDPESSPERHAYRSTTRRKATGCRVYLRVCLHKMLMPGLHRPTGCAYWHPRLAARPSGWAGERP